MTSITLLNHASLLFETERSLLLQDPWLEGTCFNDGWALIDDSTSNAQVVSYLSCKNKRLYLWYSHEHPDHFSTSFLRSIPKDLRGRISIFYQKSSDKRVKKYLEENGFSVYESANQWIEIDESLKIKLVPHTAGDSFLVVRLKNKTIFCLNDCILEQADIERLSMEYGKVDVCCAQFGYGNWLENEGQNIGKETAAKRKIEKLIEIFSTFRVDHYVMYASYAFFCTNSNFHCNWGQNTPKRVVREMAKNHSDVSVQVMTPWDSLELSDFENDFKANFYSKKNIEYWENKIRHIKPFNRNVVVDFIEVEDAYFIFRDRAQNYFWGAEKLLELFGWAGKLTVHIVDLDRIVIVSYLSTCLREADDDFVDIETNSSSLDYMLRHAFGHETLLINGMFSACHENSVKKIYRFFILDRLMMRYPSTLAILFDVIKKWLR